MRIFLASLAAAGVVLLALGIAYSTRTLGLIGGAALVVAAVMAALAAPKTRRDR